VDGIIGGAADDAPADHRALSASWVAVLTLALCVASEYKFRARAVDQTINGRIDPFIVIELSIYALVGLFLLRTMPCPPRLRAANRVQVTRWIYVGVLAASATYAAYPALAAGRAGERAATELGWRAATPFTDGVKSYVDWLAARVAVRDQWLPGLRAAASGDTSRHAPAPRRRSGRPAWLTSGARQGAS